MSRQLLRFLLPLLSIQLLFPSMVLSKRPKGDEVLLLSEKIELAKKEEDTGKYQKAEELYLELYKEYKKEFEWHRESENHWLDYMTSLRALISFYYGQGKFQDVNWYFREYNDELEEDEEVGNLQWMLMQAIEDSVQKLIKRKQYKDAELIYLDLENRITSTLGFRHFLLGLLYRNMTAFYVKTGDQTKAAEYAKKAGTMMKDE